MGLVSSGLSSWLTFNSLLTAFASFESDSPTWSGLGHTYSSSVEGQPPATVQHDKRCICGSLMLHISSLPRHCQVNRSVDAGASCT